MYDAKRILVPVDFSEVSRAAVSAAIQFAEGREGAELYLLHIQKDLDKTLQSEIVDDPHDEGGMAKGIEADEQALREVVDLEYSRAAEAGKPLTKVPVHVRISGGDALEVVLQMIDEHELDLIVSGTHGPKGLKGFLLGSTTEQLVSKATCSVWVVKPKGYPYLRD
jgi:nucleotide-binding universal stress UspA family protein